MAETFTVNYNWTKPEVGASVDAWGGYINADLDGIDTTVKAVSTVANAAYPASNPSGYITAIPVASTTVLGGVKVDGTTITATGAGVISAVGSSAINPNRLDNGDMTIDQHGTGAGVAVPVAGATGTFISDRWQVQASKASKLTGGNLYNGTSSLPAGFQSYAGIKTTAAQAPAAADYFLFLQSVEGGNISDFGWGAAGANAVTLSFWVYCSLTGTFSGSLNGATPRSYVFTYSIPTANTWTKITITIPGDTAGTWTLSGANTQLYVIFDLGSGSTSRTASTNAWIAGTFYGATGAVSPVSTLNAIMSFTGVKLELGSVATAYPTEDTARKLARCQRYYQTVQATMRVLATGAANYDCTVTFPPMRASPTSTPLSLSTANVATANLIVLSANSARHEIASAAAGDAYSIGSSFSLSAEI